MDSESVVHRVIIFTLSTINACNVASAQNKIIFIVNSKAICEGVTQLSISL